MARPMNDEAARKPRQQRSQPLGIQDTELAAFFYLGESVTQNEDSARSFRLIDKGPLFVNEYDLLLGSEC